MEFKRNSLPAEQGIEHAGKTVKEEKGAVCKHGLKHIVEFI